MDDQERNSLIRQAAAGNKKAWQEITALAFTGDIKAQLFLGNHYYEEGQGDVAKAFYWFMRAAKQEDARGQFFVGELYETGRGAPHDFSRALYWYRLAAAQDDAYAETRIGNFYENGIGVDQDYQKAWY